MDCHLIDGLCHLLSIARHPHSSVRARWTVRFVVVSFPLSNTEELFADPIDYIGDAKTYRDRGHFAALVDPVRGYSICGDSHRPVSCSFVAWCSLLSPLQCRTPNLSTLVDASYKQITRLHKFGWHPFNCRRKRKYYGDYVCVSCVSFVQKRKKTTFGHFWICVYIRVHTTFVRFLFISVSVNTRKTHRWQEKRNFNGLSSSEKPMNKHTEEMDVCTIALCHALAGALRR